MPLFVELRKVSLKLQRSKGISFGEKECLRGVGVLEACPFLTRLFPINGVGNSQPRTNPFRNR